MVRSRNKVIRAQTIQSMVIWFSCSIDLFNNHHRNSYDHQCFPVVSRWNVKTQHNLSFIYAGLTLHQTVRRCK